MPMWLRSICTVFKKWLTERWWTRQNLQRNQMGIFENCAPYFKRKENVRQSQLIQHPAVSAKSYFTSSLPSPHKTSRKTCKEKAYVGRRRPAFNFCTSYSTQCHTMHRMRISQGTLYNTSNKSTHTCARKGGEASMTELQSKVQVELSLKCLHGRATRKTHL